MPSRNNNDDNRRMPGSSKKQQSFVGRESPVDMTQAILQGDKLNKTISVVVKNAKTGISSVQKAHKVTASSILGDISTVDKASRKMYRAQEDSLTRVERRAVSAYARAKDAAKQMMDIDSESSRRRKELAAEEDRMLGNYSKKAEAYSKKHVKDALDSAKKLNDQIERDKKELAEIEQRASRGKASTQDAKRAAELEKTISDNTDAYNKCRDDVSGMLDKQASTYQAIANTIVDSLMIFANVFTDGVDKYSRAFESSFTDIAARGNFSSKKEVYEVYDDARGAVKGDMNKVINISDDMIPALQEAYKNGLTSNTALTKAYNDALSKTVMPWLDTMSENWVNMSINLSEDRMKTIKGQQLLLKESESGNRLLQSGIINSLLNDIAPELINIEYNTGSKGSDLSEEYQSIMSGLLEKGYSGQEAYATVKKLMSADMNQYNAMVNGDTVTKMYIGGQLQGKSKRQSFGDTNSTINGMAAASGSNLGASAIFSVLGKPQQTVSDTLSDAKRALTVTDKEGMSYINNFYDDLTSGRAEFKWDELLEDPSKYVSNTKSTDNMIENAAAVIADKAVGIPHGVEILGNIFNLLKTYLAGKAVSGIAKLLGGGEGGGLLSSLGSGGGGLLGKIAGGSKGLLGKAASGLSGGLSKFGSVLTGGATSTAMGVAGIAAGGIMMAKDAVKATKKADEWGTSKSSAAVAGAVFGSEDKPSLKNTARQTAKYAAIGAGIGSLIPGVGTLVGAGVGAAAGAISSIVSGRQVAQAIDKGKEKIKKGIHSLAEKTKNAYEKTKAKVSNVKDKVKEKVSNIKDKAKDKVKGAAKTAIGLGKKLLGIKDDDDKKDNKSSKSASSISKKKNSNLSTMKVSKLYVESLVTSSKTPDNKDTDKIVGRLSKTGGVSSARVMSVLGSIAADAIGWKTKSETAKNVPDVIKSDRDPYSALVAGAEKIQTRTSENTEKDSQTSSSEKSDYGVIVDTIRYCTSAIVDAINKKNAIDDKNNLLPLSRGDVNMDIVNLYSTSPSSSTTV